MTEPRYVTVPPGVRVEMDAVYAGLRKSGLSYTLDYRAAVSYVLAHHALVEPFLNTAVRVSTAGAAGVIASIDWSTVGALLRERHAAQPPHARLAQRLLADRTPELTRKPDPTAS